MSRQSKYQQLKQEIIQLKAANDRYQYMARENEHLLRRLVSDQQCQIRYLERSVIALRVYYENIVKKLFFAPALDIVLEETFKEKVSIDRIKQSITNVTIMHSDCIKELKDGIRDYVVINNFVHGLSDDGLRYLHDYCSCLPINKWNQMSAGLQRDEKRRQFNESDGVRLKFPLLEVSSTSTNMSTTIFDELKYILMHFFPSHTATGTCIIETIPGAMRQNLHTDYPKDNNKYGPKEFSALYAIDKGELGYEVNKLSGETVVQFITLEPNSIVIFSDTFAHFGAAGHDTNSLFRWFTYVDSKQRKGHSKGVGGKTYTLKGFIVDKKRT